MIDAGQVVVEVRLLDGREAQVLALRIEAALPDVEVQALVAEEEVGLVLRDRTSDRAAQLPQHRVRLLEVLLLDEEVLRGQPPARVEAEPAAMELVGSRLADGVDDPGRGGLVLGVHLVRDDLELGDRLEGRLRLRLPPAQVVVVGPAVQHEHDAGLVLTVDADAGRARTARRRQLHAGQQGDEAGEVAARRRQVLQLLQGHVAADLGRGQVDQGRLAGNRDRLLQRPDLQRQVDLHRRPDLQDDVLGDELAEAREPRGERVRPGLQAGQRVLALGPRDGLAEGPGLFVGGDDGRAGEHAALLVENDSANRGRSLCVGGRGCGARQPESEQNDYDGTHGCTSRKHEFTPPTERPPSRYPSSASLSLVALLFRVPSRLMNRLLHRHDARMTHSSTEPPSAPQDPETTRAWIRSTRTAP